jgi:hypothetical protein
MTVYKSRSPLSKNIKIEIVMIAVTSLLVSRRHVVVVSQRVLDTLVFSTWTTDEAAVDGGLYKEERQQLKVPTQEKQERSKRKEEGK